MGRKGLESIENVGAGLATVVEDLITQLSVDSKGRGTMPGTAFAVGQEAH